MGAIRDISSALTSLEGTEAVANQYISENNYDVAHRVLKQYYANQNLTSRKGASLEAFNSTRAEQHLDRLAYTQTAALKDQVTQQEAQLAEQQASLDAQQQSYWDANARAEALRQQQAARTSGSMLGSGESAAPSTKTLLGVG